MRFYGDKKAARTKQKERKGKKYKKTTEDTK